MSDSRTIAEACGCTTTHYWYEGAMGYHSPSVSVSKCLKHGGPLPHYPLLEKQIEGYKTLIEDLNREYGRIRSEYDLKQRIQFLENLLKFHRVPYPEFVYKK
jgi:hypothetical protein